MAIVLSVLLLTASDYHFGILWPLYYLSFYLRLLITTLVVLWPLYYMSFYLRLLITTLVSCGHCIICPSIYGFWLPLWYLVAIVLSVLLFTASDYHFGILWPLYYLSFYLRLLITTLVSCGHCIICPSIYGFWLPLWYLVAIVLSVLLFTASDYHFGVLWPLYYLSFYLRLLITTLVSCGHFIICPSIYGFWLPLWYLVIIVLYVLLFTASDYHFGILWPLYYLSFYLRLLITTLVSCGHCIICPSIYGFWLPLWYIVAIVLSVLLFTASDTTLVSCGHCIIYPFISSDYHFGILWSLYYLSFYLRLLITTLVSCGHCIICPSIYGFWLPLWYLVAIVLYVLLFTASDYHFGKIILWPLYYLTYLRLLITTLESCGHCIICPSTYGFWLPLWYLVAIVLSVLLFTASDYHFGVLWSCGHCIICPSIYGFWLPLWYLAAIVLSVLLFTASNYHFGILWPLYYLSFYLRLLITTLVSCGHCIICPSIYGFWLPLWYLVAIVLSDLLFTASDYHFGILWPLHYLSFYIRFWWPLWCLVAIVLSVLLFTASDYHFGILWPFYYLSFYLRLLITTLVSCDHCIICPSIYGFWLPLWYLVTIVLYVLLFSASDYHFGILLPLYYLSFYLRLLITTLVYCCHCIICPSIYGFWLPLWYLVAIVLSVLLFTASDYHFGVLWSLYYLTFYLRLLITTLVSCGHCIICPSIYAFDDHFGVLWPLYYLSFYLRLLITTLVSCGHFIISPSIYGFWLPLWYLVIIVLYVLLFTASDYHFGILWPLYYLSFYLRLLITTLVSCDHCVICPSIYGFWLPIWYIVAIVLSVLLFTASDYHFGILWPLYYLTFYLRLLITTLVSCGHCIICPSIYGFWLPLWYLVAIVLSVLLFTASDYHFGILWPLYYLSFYLRLLITTLVYCCHCIICPSIYGFWLPLWYNVAIVLSVLLFTASDYHFGILLPLYYLSFYLRLLIITLVSCGHCIIWLSIYDFWLPLWYLVAIVLSVLLFTATDYHFGILWPLYYLSFYLRLLITTLVSCGHCIICPSIYGFWLPLWYIVAIVLSVLLFTASDYHFGILLPLYYLSFYLRLLITTLVYCCHCIICPSIYGFWLPLWYIVAIVLSVLLFTASDYHFGILWPLYYLSFYLRLLITTLVSCCHCIICPSIYGFRLPLWYLVTIVLYVLLFTASDYHFGILWPLYYLTFYLRLLITTLVSCGHCIICPSIYGYWLPLWYLVAIVLSVLLFTASDYHFGILWPLYYMSFYLRLLITTLVSCGHCIIWPSIYGFWLPLSYLVAIVLSVLLFTASDYHFGILWPLYYLSFYLRLLITTLVSCGHCIICPSIYGFWLPIWYLVAIVLFVLLFTACDYHFGILWPFYYLSFYLRLLITTLVSCDHCVICPSIYGFWLPLWYIVAIVLSVLLFTASDYHFGILWPLYYLSFYFFWLPLWYLVVIVLSVLLFPASEYHFGILRPWYYLSFYLRLLITTLVSCGHCIICPSINGFWLPLW